MKKQVHMQQENVDFSRKTIIIHIFTNVKNKRFKIIILKTTFIQKQTDKLSYFAAKPRLRNQWSNWNVKLWRF